MAPASAFVSRREEGRESERAKHHVALDVIRRAFKTAGVEFTNGDQPGVRLAKAAAAHSLEPARTSNPTVTAKSARRKAARATEKKR